MSSETDSWRPLAITFTPPHLMLFRYEVFCNGAVPWCSRDKTSLYFDVDRECLKTMPTLKLVELCYKHEILYFGESRGHWHIIVTECPHPLQFDVLEMAPDYFGWFVRYHVNLDAVRVAFPEIIWSHHDQYVFSVLHVVQPQKEEVSIVVVCMNTKAIAYNVHNGTVKKLCELEPSPSIQNCILSSSYYKSFDTSQYFEILTSV